MRRNTGKENDMKRLTAFLLAALMLLSVTACGVSNEPPAENTNAATTEAATEGETDFFPAVEKADYDKASFRMIGFEEVGSWYYAEEYSNGEGNTHILNNTIYEMNTLVEEYLNVTLEYERIDSVYTGGEVFDKVQPSIMSGDDTYQLCILHPYYSYCKFITQNFAMDFNTLPDFDIEQPYWNQEVIERLSINGHNFIGLGDICLYTVNMIYCNKDLLTDANRSVPYEEVRNGAWTLDSFFALTSELYRDDGDGKRNNTDVYGFAGLWDANGSAFMQGCDIYVATRNADDQFELSLYGDRLITMYEKLYNWSLDESTYLWTFGNRADESVIIDFLDGQAYFTHAKLDTQYLEAEFSLGMLPMPKYDTQQAQYAHVNWGNNIVMPCTVRDKDMAGQVLELMGYYSKTLVQQRYYDDVLQLRVSEAPDDRDMVELIYDTIVYDPGIAFCDGNNQLWNLVYLTCFSIHEKNANITSYYQRNARSAQRWLDNLFTKVS